MTQNKNLFKQLKQLFLEIDPASLISSGAPDDEYDNEINNIIHLLIKDSIDKDNFIREMLFERFENSLLPERVENH